MAITAADIKVKFSEQGADDVVRDTRRVGNAIDQTEKSGRGFSGTMKDVAGGFLIGGLVQRGIDSVLGFGKSLISSSSDMEQFRTVLEIATGDVDAANRVFNTTRKLAADTPFEFPELVQGAANLESFGISSEKWLPIIGNAAAGTHKSVDQVVQAVLDASTGEFERLKELGIRTKVEGDKVKFSFMKNGKEMVVEAENTQEGIQDALGDIWDQKYAGAMDKLADSFEGRFSTLTDNIRMRAQDLFAPFFRVLSDSIGVVNAWFAAFDAAISLGVGPLEAAFSSLSVVLTKVFGRETAGQIQPFLDIIQNGFSMAGQVIQAFGQLLSSAFALVSRHLDIIVPAIAGVVAVFGTLFAVSGSVAGLTAALAGLAAGIAFLLSPLGLLIAASAALGIAWQQNFLGIQDVTKAVINVITDLVGTFTDLREQGFDPVQAALLTIGGTFEGLLPTMENVYTIVTNLVDAFRDFVNGDFNAGFGAIGDAADAAWAIVRDGLGLIRDISGEVAGWVINVGVPTVTGWLADAAGDVWAALTKAAGWFWTGLVNLGKITLGIAGWLVESAAPFTWSAIKSAAAWTWDQVAKLGSITLVISDWLVDATVDLSELIRKKINGWIYGSGVAGAGAAAAAVLGGGINVGTVGIAIADWAIEQIGDLAADLKAKVIEWVQGLDLTSTDVITVGTSIVAAINDAIDQMDWSGTAIALAAGIGDAIGSGVADLVNMTAGIMDWLTSAIEGIDYNNLGQLIGNGIGMAIIGLVGGIALLGIGLKNLIETALTDIDWSALASSAMSLLAAMIQAGGDFVTGLATGLYDAFSSAIGEADWSAIGTAIKDKLVDAVKGVGSAIWGAIWGEISSDSGADTGSTDDVDPSGLPRPEGGEGPTIPTGDNSGLPAPLPPGFLGTGSGDGNLGSLVGKQMRSITESIRAEVLNWVPPITAAGTAMGISLTTALTGMLTGTQTQFTAIQTTGTTAATNLQTGVLANLTSLAAGWGTTLSGMATDTATRFGIMRTTGTSESSGLQQSALANAGAMAGGWATRLIDMASSTTGRFADIRRTGSSEADTLRDNALSSAGSMSANWAGTLSDMGSTTASRFAGIRQAGSSEASSLGSNVARSIGGMAGDSAAKMLGMQMGLAAKFLSMKASGVSSTNDMSASVTSTFATMGVRSALNLGQGLSTIPGIVRNVGSQAASVGYSAGAAISAGFANGMYAYLGGIRSAANAMVSAAYTAVRARALIASPSKLFATLGEQLGAGLAVGLASQRERIAGVARDITAELDSIMTTGVGDLTDSLGTVLAMPIMNRQGQQVIPVAGIDNSRMSTGVTNVHNYYSVTPEDLRQLIDNARAGGEFAAGFGSGIALKMGKG